MKLTDFTVKQLQLKDLKPYSLNPRKQTPKGANSLKTSLDKYGQVRPFVLNYDLTIIGGNQMYDVLFKAHGATYTVDCYVSDKQLEEAQVKELNILLNKDAGAWDYEMLKKYNDENVLNTHFEAWELNTFQSHMANMPSAVYESNENENRELGFERTKETETKDYSAKNKELNLNDFAGKKDFVLKLETDEFFDIQERLANVKRTENVATNEQAIFELLNFYEQNKS